MTIKKQVLLDYGLHGAICLVYAILTYLVAFRTSWSFVIILGLNISVCVAGTKREKLQYDDEMSQSFKDKAGNKTIQTLLFAIVVFFALDFLALIDMTKIYATMDYRALLLFYGFLRILYCFYYLMEEKKKD